MKEGSIYNHVVRCILLTIDLVDATFGEDRPLSAECLSQTLRYDSRCVSSSHSNCNCAWKVVHAESLQETPDYL